MSFFGDGDVDLAASRGTAGFVSITVGVFIGIKLTLLTMRAFSLWIAQLAARLELYEQRTSYLTGQSGHDDPPEETRKGFSPLMVRLGIYFVVLGGGFSGAGVGLVQMVIKAGTDLYGPSVYLATLACLVIALLGVLGTVWELRSIGRAMSQIERRLSHNEDVLNMPAVAYPRHADIALQSTHSWVYKVTGMRGWQPGTATF